MALNPEYNFLILTNNQTKENHFYVNYTKVTEEEYDREIRKQKIKGLIE